MIGNVISLLIAILILTAVWHLVTGMLNTFRKDLSPNYGRVISEPIVPEVTSQPEQEPELVQAEPELAAPLIVKHLDHGKATLILRYRVRKKACTAQLIVWSGAKRRRIQDSYYDLGILAKDKVDEDVVKEFLKLAQERLDDLRTAGKRTRMRKVEEVALEAQGDSHQQRVTAGKEAEEIEEPPALETKLRRFPSVYRGIITEMGMMVQEKNGAPFKIYGVRYRTQEGLEDAVFGANLKIALRDAMAGVGDTVEILKIGRKTVECGKAPMNLFKVAKISDFSSTH